MTDAKINTLLHCLLEELVSNGGHFASPDTDLLFRRAFLDGWEDGDKTTKKALEDLTGAKGLANNSKPTTGR